VIGKEFPLGLLRAVAERGEEDLYRNLSHLQAGEFVYEQPAFPDPEYTFKHALTQEVAYQSLLGERRGALHERTAQAIEELYREALDEHYGDLAHHYGRTENTPKAVEYLLLAGEQAVQRSAYTEAIDQLNRGVERVANLPETRERTRQELLLQLALGEALVVTRGYTAPEVEHAYVRARDLCEQADEAPQLFRALLGLHQHRLARGEFGQVRELAEQLLGVARETGDPAHWLEAHVATGEISHWRGEFHQARERLEEAIRRYDPQQHRSHEYLYSSADPAVWALFYLTPALWGLGYPDQASTRSREALALARELAHPFSQALTLCNASRAHWVRGESQAALEEAEALIALSSEHGFPFWLGIGTFMRASALADQGRLPEAIAEMGTVLEALRAAGAVLGWPFFLAILAEAHARAGQVEEGLAVISEALEFVARTGERDYEAEVRRVEGGLLLARSPSDPAGAEASFREALDVAGQQSAKSFELRAATSLARLWQQQGRGQDARDLLAPVYDWFTEGFDTRDLRQAKTLLEELS
jgi:predicted ATPase